MAIRKMFKKKARKSPKKRRALVKSLSFKDNSNRVFKAVIESFYEINNPAHGAAIGYDDLCVTATLNHPTYGRVASGEGVFPQSSAKLAQLTNVFDMYRVIAMECIYVPDFVDTQTTGTTTTADAPSIVYMYNDHDDNALVTSELNMLNGGERPRSYVRGNPQKHVFRNPDKEWLNTGVISVTSDIAGVPTAVTQGTTQNPRAYASTKVYFPRVYHRELASGIPTYIGRLYIRWLVEFKAIKTA